MGFRVRKSFKVAPGVRMTVTPRGVSGSVGVRGARVTAHSSGRMTRTVGIPGTGVSHTSTIGGGSRSAPARGQRAAPAVIAPAPPKPGLLAPKWEKALHQAAVAKPDPAALPKIAEAHPEAAPLVAVLEAIQGAIPAGQLPRARDLLSWVWSSGFDPATDPFVRKYLGQAALSVGIAEGIEVPLPLDRDTVGLLLAELHQRLDGAAVAIDVVEQLTPSTITAVSLAELYADLKRWSDIVELTNGVRNEDDAATFLLVQRGIALREEGYHQAARDAFKEALRVRSRPAALRHRAYVERGQTYLAEGKAAMARKDFERVMAEDSSYLGLREELDRLSSA